MINLTHLYNKFVEKLSFFASNIYILALRDGMASTIPLVIVGSLFLLLGVFPWYPESFGIKQLIIQNQANILIPFRLTVGLVAIFVVYNASYSLANAKKLHAKTAGSISLLAFFMLIIPTRSYTLLSTISEGAKEVIINNKAYFIKDLEWFLPMQFLGAQGLFGAIVCALVVPTVIAWFKRHKLTISMPAGVPEPLARSFEVLIPTFFIVLFIFIIRILLSIDVHNLLYIFFSPIKNYMSSIWGVLFIVFLESILWFAGVHGAAIIGSIVRPFWLVMITQNSENFAQGLAPEHLMPEQSLQWFVFFGGIGGTLGLAFLLAFTSKSIVLKQLGKVSLLPAIFNINEPIVFGLPLVLNPYFIIPFIFGPLISTITTYLAMYYTFVRAPISIVPWTLPSPLGAYLTTLDVNALILVSLNIIITTSLYYIPLKMYDNKMLLEEKLKK